MCAIPPAKWSDVDVERFDQELAQLCARFQRIEALTFEAVPGDDVQSAMRFSITQLNGAETDMVIHVPKEEDARVKEVEKRVSDILAESSSVGLAGAVRALWKAVRANGEGVMQ